MGWLSAYSDVLQNVGWTLQESGWVDYSTQGTSAQVHEKILEVATAALALTAAALAIITASVNALKGWIQQPVVDHLQPESQKAKIARFQVGFVSADDQGDVFVSPRLPNRSSKQYYASSLFQVQGCQGYVPGGNSAKVSVNKASITDLGDAIRQKTRAYQQDYLSGILNLKL